MSSGISFWKNVSGFGSRCNDILYARPTSPCTRNLLLFFGGDIQDFQKNMEKNKESKQYVAWSLENTAKILSEQFPEHHVFITRPARMLDVFSCFDNFVKSNELGVPTFTSNHDALKHLEKLIQSFMQRLIGVTSNEGKGDLKLTLMGFSKGCVVLNQLLHEFHYYLSQPSGDVGIHQFIKQIKDMWWLDGGHAGQKDTWITSAEILESFAKLKISIFIHVTPYQIRSSERPWIGKEESCFYNILKKLNAPIKRTVHFEGKPQNLEMHFNLLKNLRTPKY